MRRRVFTLLVVLLLAGAAGFFLVAPRWVAAYANATRQPPPYDASAGARALHRQLRIADLHADTLLWDRDLLDRSPYGHADVPRLIAGNVALQVFSAVSKAPFDIQMQGNDPGADAIRWLFVAQLRPPSTWRRPMQRVLHQAQVFREAAARSNGQLVFVQTAGDLSRYLERRAGNSGMVAGVLAVEGVHDAEMSDVEALFAAGIRIAAPVHLADNDLAGSAHGRVRDGLTDKGRALIRRMDAVGITIDLAHMSPRAFDEVIALTERPVVVSHAGIQGTCDNPRNLSDAQLRSIQRTGGLVGIGFWPAATCGTDPAAVARAVRHAVNVAGLESVALGSDFDGAVEQPFDAAGHVLIAEALLAEGFSEEGIRAVMGENLLRLLGQALP